MHPMVGKTFVLKYEDETESRTYTIVSVDTEGWIKLKRENVGGHFYLNEEIHKHFLDKLGYQRSTT